MSNYDGDDLMLSTSRSHFDTEDDAELSRLHQSDLDDADDEDMDETLVERLIGLSEMFPERLQKFVSSAITLTWSGTKQAYSYGRVGVWVLASSFAILALPVLFESERSQMEEQQMQQQRQMLLGPNVAMSGHGHMSPGLSGMPALPQVSPPGR